MSNNNNHLGYNRKKPKDSKSKTFLLSVILIINYIILAPLALLGFYMLFYYAIIGVGILLVTFFFLALNIYLDLLHNKARIIFIAFFVVILTLSLLTNQLLITAFSLLEIVILGFDYNTRMLFKEPMYYNY